MADSTADGIPKWMLWYGVLILVGAPLGFGLNTLLTTELGQVELVDGSTIETANFAYALRNLVAAFIAGFALYMGSKSMLLLVFIMRLLTELGDIAEGTFTTGMEVVQIISIWLGTSVVFFGPYIYAIGKLWGPTVSETRKTVGQYGR